MKRKHNEITPYRIVSDDNIYKLEKFERRKDNKFIPVYRLDMKESLNEYARKVRYKSKKVN